MSFKCRELSRVLDSKPEGDAPRDGRERNRWLTVDGVKVLRVTYPHGHGGGQDVPPGTLAKIRRSLRLAPEQLERFVVCTMSATEYAQHLRKLRERGEI